MVRRASPVIPNIDDSERFDTVVRKLSTFFVQAIETPHEWDELRREVYPRELRSFVRYLVDDVQHEGIVSALLALKWHFDGLDDGEDRGVNETRGLACELVAWRFISHLTYRETIDYLCTDLPVHFGGPNMENGDLENAEQESSLPDDQDEESPLLENSSAPVRRMDDSFYDEMQHHHTDTEQANFASTFANLSALEIAAVAGAKKFLSQRSIQYIIYGLWRGDIVFWSDVSTHSRKEAKVYRKHQSDPYARLRVPLYLKIFEVLFFAGFLALYYIVLIRKQASHITGAEIMLYVWLASFSYNELVEFNDAGLTFYATDFWSLWDLGIIFVGIAFFVARMIGLAHRDSYVNDIAFDILSVEALFLVPRICSLLSLHPYFGMLLPVLKAMTVEFLKFLSLVVIMFFGFSTCFSFLARGTYSFRAMNWILIKVFFGSSYLGFDVADQISPVLGPPIMLVFVALTNILLITSLISLLSNKLDKVMEHARDEYMFVYSVYVLEASTSNRLTYFYPVLNLLPLLLRPLRLVSSPQRLRAARIVLLKATHWPLVAMILLYERALTLLEDRRKTGSSGVQRSQNSPTSLRRPLYRKAPSMSRTSLLEEQPRTARSPAGLSAHGFTAASDSAERLNSVVADLHAQVQVLTELLVKEKRLSADACK
ncbi:hypothetical protein CKM354_000489400 [Cercospora kikuchii]|uniref:Calcium channel YVC1-like C-terminal transmembrane domain-containing protein n=1 Tax=Cercospora kikuchii TaxID=84275 RepID=A0A9P3FGL1_9PEZI|nr:uncharacterized protein CKM354_000489400 [Cercospora kikuchii]GIZ41595.1 hypothetical protein CKM354_000489400 [Cercospora kikuchii]